MISNLSQTFVSKEYVIYAPQVLRFIYAVPSQNSAYVAEPANPKLSKKQIMNKERKHKIALISKD